VYVQSDTSVGKAVFLTSWEIAMNEEPITDKTSLFEKGMALFALIVCDGGHRSVRELAQEVNIPPIV